VRISGGVSTYDFLDSADLTHKVAGKWDDEARLGGVPFPCADG
jgi:hypothetical protein